MAVPARLGIVVGVDVDEPRRHQHPAGVDLFRGRAEPAPDRRNAPVTHRDVGRERLAASAVQHGPAAHDQVILRGHRRVPYVLYTLRFCSLPPPFHFASQESGF